MPDTDPGIWAGNRGCTGSPNRRVPCPPGALGPAEGSNPRHATASQRVQPALLIPCAPQSNCLGNGDGLGWHVQRTSAVGRLWHHAHARQQACSLRGLLPKSWAHPCPCPPKRYSFQAVCTGWLSHFSVLWTYFANTILGGKNEQELARLRRNFQVVGVLGGPSLGHGPTASSLSAWDLAAEGECGARCEQGTGKR